MEPLADARGNKLLRRVRRLLANRQAREKWGQTVLEGVRLVEDAWRGGLVLEAVIYSPRLVQTARGQGLLMALQSGRTRTLYVTDAVLAELADVETHQGILAVVEARLPRLASALPPPGGMGVVLVGVQDPGNAGTLIRSAAAAGVDLVGIGAGTVDPFNPKAVRASAGAVFRTRVGWLEPGWEQSLGGGGARWYAAEARGGRPYGEVDWSGTVVLLLGNEGAGLPAAVRERAQAVSIPMEGGVESLNVGVAGSVLLFHAARERARMRMQVKR
ncbi:RNA methyltransferase [Candidatus Hydrogenisulfobacillus filiaventi]|uniref:RNA methyltransferase n=1 Tax=Candidatus Hydrogenisulfobacillus filiaventi TaxID=2707344 RepID=A0A6F8ZEW0_9FIRM|nr:RNA methyltransferase [Candidatus Hydrogenisulfobacillus filiaventi]